MLLFLVSILFILAYFYATRNFGYWQKCGVPFEKPVPFLGNVPLVFFKKCLGTYLKDLYEKSTGPLYGFFILDKPFLIVRDPDIIKHILVKDFKLFSDRTVTVSKAVDPVGARVLFVIQNPEWRKIRQKMTTAFSSGKLRQVFPSMVEVGRDMVKYVEMFNGEPLEGKPLTMKFATDVIASCAFGVKGFSFEKDDSEFYSVSQKITAFNWSRAIQCISCFLSPILAYIFKMSLMDPQSVEYLKKVFWEVYNSKKKAGVKHYNFIDSLMEIRKADNDLTLTFDDDLTIAQAIQFIVAGLETSGSTPFFTFYELALHNDVQHRLRKEIFDVCQKQGGLTYDAIQEMTYLDMVLSEILRKYPTIPFLDRRAQTDYKIPGTDVTIEKGIPVYIPLLGLHYDPEYFPNPKKFDPERFSPENNMAMSSKMHYLPFGEGPRSCIGARFGSLSSKLSVIFMVLNFEILTTDDTPQEIEFEPRGLLLHPLKKIHLRFKKINSSENTN